jgi:hypothetical protein
MRFFWHAATLASVGWYLMFPSAIGEGSFKGYPDLSLPLTDWNIYQSFDSAKDCEGAKGALENKLLLSVNASTGKAQDRAFLWMKSPICIASDDLRLKEK